MIIHMEGGRIYRYGSPAEVLADLDVREEIGVGEREADHKTDNDISDDSNKQSSAVSKYQCFCCSSACLIVVIIRNCYCVYMLVIT